VDIQVPERILTQVIVVSRGIRCRVMVGASLKVGIVALELKPVQFLVEGNHIAWT